MNSGEESIEWLYQEQLRIDNIWSIRNESGFTWWADQQAQTIEIHSAEEDESGSIAHLISTKTELLTDCEYNAATLAFINQRFLRSPSMSGVVFDESSGSCYLQSLVRVYPEIASWMNPLISVSAALQLYEVRVLTEHIPAEISAILTSSQHPDSGSRATPDEIAQLAESLIIPHGNRPAQWQTSEFHSVVDDYMQGPPVLLANSSDTGLTVEFPFGDASSLLQINADQAHPLYGSGLLILQAFPTENLVTNEEEGIVLALTLNEEELVKTPFGYGFGSYSFINSTLHFSTFIPNVAYRPNMLPNFYFAAGQRARTVSYRLTGNDWSQEQFSPMKSAMGRLIDRVKTGKS
jgi:hypothetical protein